MIKLQIQIAISHVIRFILELSTQGSLSALVLTSRSWWLVLDALRIGCPHRRKSMRSSSACDVDMLFVADPPAPGRFQAFCLSPLSASGLSDPYSPLRDLCGVS